MSSGIKDRIVIGCRDVGQLFRMLKLSLRGAVCAKAAGQVSLVFRHVAFRVDRWHIAFRRSQRDFRSGILERIIGGNEFFQPEAGFLSSVAKLIMGCQNDENFHVTSPLWKNIETPMEKLEQLTYSRYWHRFQTRQSTNDAGN